jgi:hypothetical protein
MNTETTISGQDGKIEVDEFKFDVADFGGAYATTEGPYLCICNGCQCSCWTAKQD